MKSTNFFSQKNRWIAYGAAVALMPGFALAQSPSKEFRKDAAHTKQVEDASKPDFVSVAPSGEANHILVGHSVFVSSKHRLVRVYVTNPDVLDAYAATPTQVVITSKQPGIGSLVLWDDAGTQRTYVFTSDVNIDSLQTALKQAFPHEAMTVRVDEGRVVLTGDVSSSDVADAAGKFAAHYAKDVSNAVVVNSSIVKQVRLKVRIIEVDRSKLTQFGFNFFSTGGKTLAATTTGQFPSSLLASSGGSSTSNSSGGSTATVGGNQVAISNPLNFLIYNSTLNIGATLQDMETKQVLQILAEPTITTMSGQKANFLAGGEFPFPVVQGVSGGSTSISIQFRSYGVKVEFLPVVNNDNTVQLKVAPEVSALDYTNAVSISGYTIPALSTRRAETQVVLRSGQSFAISGLLDKRATDSLGHTPGISSIPILGELFKSKSINHSNEELVVIVTPEIVDPLTDTEALPADPKQVVKMLDPTKFDDDVNRKKGAK